MALDEELVSEILEASGMKDSTFKGFMITFINNEGVMSVQYAYEKEVTLHAIMNAVEDMAYEENAEEPDFPEDFINHIYSHTGEKNGNYMGFVLYFVNKRGQQTYIARAETEALSNTLHSFMSFSVFKMRERADQVDGDKGDQGEEQ